MSLRVDQIISVSRFAVLKAMGRMEYMFSDPAKSPTGYWCRLRDSKSEKSVPMYWTKKDNDTGTEEDRLEMATNLMKNAVWSLDMLKGIEPDWEDD